MDTKDQKNLEEMSQEELLELRKFLFEERIRIAAEQEKQQQVYEKFLKERLVFMQEMKALNSKVLNERKRLKDETKFFDKKLQILQNGFTQLDLDRKQFEREKKLYRQKTESAEGTVGAYGFFRGVTSTLGLKKRYKDLLKIFHPDNVCGDSETVKEINRQYEFMKRKFD